MTNTFQVDNEALEAMLADGSASAGMIAKLRACQAARDAGVADVRIVDGRDPAFSSGTRLMGGAADTRPAAGN